MLIYIDRGYYMAFAEIRNFSSSVEKYFSRSLRSLVIYFQHNTVLTIQQKMLSSLFQNRGLKLTT